MANGVRHTEKNKFLHKKFNKKKAWFVTQSNIFYFEKNSMINKLTHKIKTVFFNKFHKQVTMVISLIIK